LEEEEMKRTLALAALAVILLGVAWLGGCGSSSQAAARAQQILDKSASAIATLKSVKESGSNGMKSEDSSVPDVTVTFTSEMDLSDPANTRAHTVIQQGASVVDIYASGGYVYTKTASGEWQRTKAEGTSALAPRDLKEIAAGAKNVRLLSSAGGKYEVAFQVGEKALADSDLLDGADTDTALGKQTAEALKELKMDAVYTVAKDTMYVERARLNMRMPSVVESGETTGTMKVDFTGFNEPVSIVLPESTQNAK
jgi:hypothetical protein